jgi:hypothetical protein
MPAGSILKLHADTFKNFLPRQASPDFNPDAILAHALNVAGNAIREASPAF